VRNPRLRRWGGGGWCVLRPFRLWLGLGGFQVKAWTKSEVLGPGRKERGVSVPPTIPQEAAGNRVEVATKANEDGATADDMREDFEITVPVESESAANRNPVTSGGQVTMGI